MQQGQEETVGWEGRLLNGKGEREIWDQAIPDHSPPSLCLISLTLGQSMLRPLLIVSPSVVQRSSHQPVFW